MARALEAWVRPAHRGAASGRRTGWIGCTLPRSPLPPGGLSALHFAGLWLRGARQAGELHPEQLWVSPSWGTGLGGFLVRGMALP